MFHMFLNFKSYCLTLIVIKLSIKIQVHNPSHYFYYKLFNENTLTLVAEYSFWIVHISGYRSLNDQPCLLNYSINISTFQITLIIITPKLKQKQGKLTYNFHQRGSLELKLYTQERGSYWWCKILLHHHDIWYLQLLWCHVWWNVKLAAELVFESPVWMIIPAAAAEKFLLGGNHQINLVT